MLALALQLAATGLVPMAAAAPALDPFGAPICHAGGSAPDGGPAPHRQHDCAICPLCLSLAQAGVAVLPATLTRQK